MKRMRLRTSHLLLMAGLVVLVAGIFAVADTQSAQAVSSYMTSFRTQYPNARGTTLDSCAVCHPAGGYTLNPYAQDFAANNHSYTAIAALDSDRDGFTNIAEINALTAPGDAASHPSGSATATPTRTSVPPTATPTRTAVPPTATPTRTAVPATATRTPVATATQVGPTATRTQIPPTATATRVVPTATRTQVPPTATAHGSADGLTPPRNHPHREPRAVYETRRIPRHGQTSALSTGVDRRLERQQPHRPCHERHPDRTRGTVG